MSKYKNGSFKVSMPFIKEHTSDENFISSKDARVEYKEVMVNNLSQNELAEGWQLVVPKPKSVSLVNNYGGRIVTRNKKYYNYFKIDLSKLPNELWDNLRQVYEEGIYSHSIAKNNRYVYIVNPTVVDNEIIELRHLVNLHNWELHKDRMMELLQVLDDNNVYGWVVVKAKKLLGSHIQVL